MDKYIGEIFIQRTLKQSQWGRLTPCRATKAIFWKIIEISNDKGNCIRCTVENEDGDQHRGRFGDRTDNKPGMKLTILEHSNSDYECYGSSGIAYNKDCFNFPLKDYHNAHDWMQDFHRKLGHPVPDGHWYDGNDPNKSEESDESEEEELVELSPASYAEFEVARKTSTPTELRSIQAYETRDEKDPDDEYYVHNTEFVWNKDHWRPTETPTEDNIVDYNTPKRKRCDSVETCPPTPKKVKIVGRFTVTDANPETMTDDQIHDAITELQEELKRRVIETNAV